MGRIGGWLGWECMGVERRNDKRLSTPIHPTHISAPVIMSLTRWGTSLVPYSPLLGTLNPITLSLIPGPRPSPWHVHIPSHPPHKP